MFLIVKRAVVNLIDDWMNPYETRSPKRFSLFGMYLTFTMNCLPGDR